MTDRVPFLGHRDAEAVVAYRGGRPVRVAEFLADVEQFAARLPRSGHPVNICGDRYCFAVGLAAALARGQVSLLPSNLAPEYLRELALEYPGLYLLGDNAAGPAGFAYQRVAPGAGAAAMAAPALAFSPQQTAVIVFTSGSTGRPMPHRKDWGALVRGAAGEAQRFGLLEGEPAALVATVPPQHMYGLESSVLLAMCNGLAMHAARPFYPADVRAALEDIPAGRVLVTAPVHLRALLAEDIDLPALRLAVCATAPLDAESAARFEARYRVRLHEVYGFTEAGMIATRRTVDGPVWHALPGVRLRREGDAVLVGGGHVPREVPFSDLVEVRGGDAFTLAGRSADLVNIAGKRTSLDYLAHQLNAIPGVRDGAFFMPAERHDGITRLVAFAVAPSLRREELLAALRERVDPVFLPRPLYFVDSLPRNATGKLPREALAALAARCARASPDTVLETQAALPVDHPAARGHFPGNPVIPGAALLDEILAAARAAFDLPPEPAEIVSAKFLRAVRPGESLRLRFAQREGGAYRFECWVAGEIAASGVLRVGQPGGAA